MGKLQVTEKGSALQVDIYEKETGIPESPIMTLSVFYTKQRVRIGWTPLEMLKNEFSKFLELLKDYNTISDKMCNFKGQKIVPIIALLGHTDIIMTLINEEDLSLGWIGSEETVSPIGKTTRTDFIDFINQVINCRIS